MKVRTSEIINGLEPCNNGGIDLGRIRNNDINEMILNEEWVTVKDIKEELEKLRIEKFPTGICINSLANEKAIKVLERVILRKRKDNKEGNNGINEKD